MGEKQALTRGRGETRGEKCLTRGMGCTYKRVTLVTNLVPSIINLYTAAFIYSLRGPIERKIHWVRDWLVHIDSHRVTPSQKCNDNVHTDSHQVTPSHTGSHRVRNVMVRSHIDSHTESHRKGTKYRRKYTSSLSLSELHDSSSAITFGWGRLISRWCVCGGGGGGGYLRNSTVLLYWCI